MNTLLVLFMLATLAVLATGLITMAVGGEFNRKYGNKLMILRVIGQGSALCLLIIMLITSR